MKDYPRYEITVKAWLPIIIYIGSGIGLILGIFLGLFVFWDGETNNYVIIITQVLLSGGAILAFYAAYIAYLPKTIVIDGQSFTLSIRGRVVRQIHFKDMVELVSNEMTLKYFDVVTIIIRYIEYGKPKEYEITENVLPKKWLKLVFMELFNVALLYKIPVRDHAILLYYPSRVRDPSQKRRLRDLI